ncbi:MAG: extracellular solute-binding protein, partial [Actinomycetota bacterium]|nr:extracellular solute-binding protein [Actinomycetota bacterium]
MSRASKLAVLLIVLCLAAACTGGDSDSGDGQAGTGAGALLVAIPSEDPDDIALRQRQAKAFMAKHPEIKVKLLTIPGQGYDQKVVTMIAGGKPPDVFVSGDVQIPTIVRKRYALDLASFIERDRYDLSDFYPEVVKGLTFDGRVVGVADNWDTQVLYFNKTLFDRANVGYPDADWTWDDLVAAARKLTSGGGGEKRFGVTLDPWFAPLLDQIWA